MAQGSKQRTPLATITNGSIPSVAGRAAAGSRQLCTVAEKPTPATRCQRGRRMCRVPRSPPHCLHPVRWSWRCECLQKAAIGFGVDLFTRALQIAFLCRVHSLGWRGMKVLQSLASALGKLQWWNTGFSDLSALAMCSCRGTFCHCQ